jgi:hypothetical protein
MTLKQVKEPTKQFIKWFNDYSDFILKGDYESFELDWARMPALITIDKQDFKKLSKFYKGETLITPQFKVVLDGKGGVKFYKGMIKWVKV